MSTLSVPGFNLELLSHGLTFHSLVVNKYGHETRDLLVGPQDPNQHSLQRSFTNQVVGRYANRLPSGVTEVNGIALNLEGKDGICLHGGKGIDMEEWTPISRSTSTLFPPSDPTFPPPGAPDKKVDEVIYRLVSPTGASGFPLELEIEALVVLESPKSSVNGSVGSVVYVLRARIVDDGSAEIQFGTPVNLTVHWGFNLASFTGDTSTDILDHKLFVNSLNVLALDSSMLPTGLLTSILPGGEKPELDFTASTVNGVLVHRRIGDNFPSGGIDNNFILNDTPSGKPQVVLTPPDDKISLSFQTNQKSVQIYTAGGLDQTSTKNMHKVHNGERTKYGAIFLEFQQPVATFLHPSLTKLAATDTILRFGEVYENIVRCEIKCRS